MNTKRVLRLLRFLRSLGLVALSAFLVPALLALLLGLLLPAFLAVDFARPGFMADLSRALVALAPVLRLFFIFALSAPTFGNGGLSPGLSAVCLTFPAGDCPDRTLAAPGVQVRKLLLGFASALDHRRLRHHK